MASAFTCLCGVHFRNPTAIAKHKQYCATVQKDISQNCNFLLSTSRNDVGRGVFDNGDGATQVYDSYFASYNDVDCSSNNEEDIIESENENLSDSDDDDEHSASLSIDKLQHMNNQEDDSTTNSDDDGVSRSDDSMSCDNPFRGYDEPLFSQKQCCVPVAGTPELFIRQKQGECADVRRNGKALQCIHFISTIQ